MQNDLRNQGQNGSTQGSGSVEWETWIEQLCQAKKSEYDLRAGGATNLQLEERLEEVQRCVDLRLSRKHTRLYLFSRGIFMDRGQIARYVARCDKPRGYGRVDDASPHILGVSRLLVRCALDCWRAGVECSNEVREEEIRISRSVKDLRVAIEPYFVRFEYQRSYLTPIRWEEKLHADILTYEKTRERCTYAYLIDDRMKVDDVRNAAKQVLAATHHQSLDMFRIAHMKEFLYTERNTVTEPLWKSPLDDRPHPLIRLYTHNAIADDVSAPDS
ncbi:hypothetical protein [Blastopirellula marina]|uniref:Uncharacterized protein n=1 Tax=Blastopirellula marina TaxID=124 RepID=A0A2S8GSK5_9BACT|nr:hypothetical protein [Blastopirellula marina]PQO47361.1 hypothetical protein C5Y93_04785 [Blastopirellula marina]